MSHDVARQRLGREPAARLEDADPVALLGEPQRRDAAAEPGSDDEHVVGIGGVLPLAWWHPGKVTRR